MSTAYRRAIDSFSTADPAGIRPFVAITEGDLLPADDPIVVAVPDHFGDPADGVAPSAESDIIATSSTFLPNPSSSSLSVPALRGALDLLGVAYPP